MRPIPLLALTLLAGAAASVSTFAPQVSATRQVATQNVDYLNIGVDAKGSMGGIGIEYDGPAVDPYGGYHDSITWRSDGTLMKVDHEVGPTYLKPKYDVNGLPIESTSTSARLEAYPRNTTDCTGYDWQAACYWENYSVENSVHGGFHMDVARNDDGTWPRVGTVTFPTVNDKYGGFVATGSIVAASTVDDGRVHVDAFQIDCWITEICPERPISTGGIPYGAFSSGPSRGDSWFMSVGWPGRYTLYIADEDSGEKVQVIADIRSGNVPTIDLNTPCFGFKECITLTGVGSPPAAASTFYPLPPTRILDTRSGLGIEKGPVRPGDGSIDTSNDDFRTDEELNHELVVTGRAGVPDNGVAAVLLNVTAVEPSTDGFITVGPRPQGRGDLFDDQNSYGNWPNASNLNFSADQTVPNLVLVRVGAGGRIRFHVHEATTHLLADIAGYFSYTDDGAGFTGVTPTRLFDSRQPAENAFGPNSRRQVQITGRAGIPDNATSAVVNITAVSPTAEGFVTAFPSSNRVPNASNLNLQAGETRPNFAVVSLSNSGAIDVQSVLPYDADGTVDLIVDVFGYYSNEGGQPTTTSEPFRIVDTRSGIGGLNSPFGSDEIRTFRAAGIGRVPSNATAIWVNLTVVSPSANGFLSAYPAGSTTPNISNLNWGPGDINPNMALIPLNSQGKFDISVVMPWDTASSADVLVDVLGWVSPT
jgi:hypothetical protein